MWHLTAAAATRAHNAAVRANVSGKMKCISLNSEVAEIAVMTPKPAVHKKRRKNRD
jgi:hypothetical protein